MKLFHLEDTPLTLAHDNLKRKRFIAPGDAKSKLQTVNYVDLKKGMSFKAHSHLDCEEYFYVIEGSAKAEVANKTLEVKTGDFIVVEPKEQHYIENNSNKSFKYLAFRILI